MKFFKVIILIFLCTEIFYCIAEAQSILYPNSINTLTGSVGFSQGLGRNDAVGFGINLNQTILSRIDINGFGGLFTDKDLKSAGNFIGGGFEVLLLKQFDKIFELALSGQFQRNTGKKIQNNSTYLLGGTAYFNVFMDEMQKKAIIYVNLSYEKSDIRNIDSHAALSVGNIYNFKIKQKFHSLSFSYSKSYVPCCDNNRNRIGMTISRQF